MTDAPIPDQPAAGGWDRRRTIWAVVAGLIVAAVVALLVVGLLNRDVGTSIQDALDAGERPDAPAFSADVLQGGDGIPAAGRVSLGDLRGRIVILNFWASWCDPCKEEAPVLERIAKRYQGRSDVVLLGMDTQDETGKAKGFLRDFGVSYPSLRDGTDATYRAYQLTGVPETFIIDRQGRIAARVIGIVEDPASVTTPVDQL
ncbi:MAG: TlpA family protein disulfide reductase [Thermoleophilia bacterium]